MQENLEQQDCCMSVNFESRKQVCMAYSNMYGIYRYVL